MDLRSHDIEARDGVTLNCWERSPTDAGEAVLFVHGAITNARALFATPVDDALAFVRERSDTVHLVGVSWGCHACGRLLEGDDPDPDPDPDLASLTMVAPAYKPRYGLAEGMSALGLDSLDVAWYTQDRETVRERQGTDDALFEAIWRAQVESNQGIDDRTYAAQTGALADWAASCRGDPVWDPAAIDVPTLVVRGSQDAIADRPGSLDHFDEMDVPGDRAEYVEIEGADHYLMHGDRRRALFETVHDFQHRVRG